MEAISHFLKERLPELVRNDSAQIFSKVVTCDMEEKLGSYETEYIVINELTACFKTEPGVDASEALRKQNKELIEQLAVCHTAIKRLEGTLTTVAKEMEAQRERIERYILFQTT